VFGAACPRTASGAILRLSLWESVLNGKAGLSGDRSLRIEKAFGVKMDTMMRMGAAYEIAQTRKREG
jgi:plasmid maintenance system antidote protein VapI